MARTMAPVACSTSVLVLALSKSPRNFLRFARFLAYSFGVVVDGVGHEGLQYRVGHAQFGHREFVGWFRNVFLKMGNHVTPKNLIGWKLEILDGARHLLALARWRAVCVILRPEGVYEEGFTGNRP